MPNFLFNNNYCQYMTATYYMQFHALPGGDSDSSSESQKWWIKDLHLADTDHQALLSGEELTDSLIFAAQTLLATQYPEIGGLQDTNKGKYLTFSSAPKNCVQIFYVGELMPLCSF